MPGPLVQAPPGGIAPRETNSIKVIKGMLLNRKETAENQRPPAEPVGTRNQEERGYNNTNHNLPEGLDLEPGQHHQQQGEGKKQDHHHPDHKKEGNKFLRPEINPTMFKRMRQPTLRWPVEERAEMPKEEERRRNLRQEMSNGLEVDQSQTMKDTSYSLSIVKKGGITGPEVSKKI